MRTWTFGLVAALTLSACIEESSEADDPGDAADAAIADSPDQGEVTPPDSGGPDLPPDARIEPDAAPPPDAAPVPACGNEDNLAPNQSAGSAVEIEPGFERDDLFLCPDTQDFFRVMLDAGQGLTARLIADPEETDLDLAILDAGGEVLVESTGELGNEQVELQAPAAAEYFMRVSGFRGEASFYTLSVASGCRVDGQCPEDAVCDPYEGTCMAFDEPDCGNDAFEPNDRDADAHGVALGEGPLEGSICGADRDWFAVDVEAGDSYEVLVATEPNIDLDVFVVDPVNGERIDAAANDARFNPERLTLSHLPAGRYAIGIIYFVPEGQPDREVPYRLELAGSSGRCTGDRDCANGPAPICNAETGVCGAVNGQGRVEFGGRCGVLEDCIAGTEMCYTGGPGGNDNFCTVTCEDDRACAAMGEQAYCAAISRRTAICVPPCVADADCSDFRECVDGACEIRGECRDDADCDEDEICQATNFGRYCNPPAPPPNCGHDGGNDPNNVDAEATALELGVLVEGLNICDADEDWYRVTVPAEGAAQLLSVAVAFRAGVDIDVYVFDAHGNAIGMAVSADQIEEVVEMRYIAPGDYLIRVVQFSTDSLADTVYTIQAELTANDERCTVEGNECAGLEPLRVVCLEESGACAPLEGNGEVPVGGTCDSQDDCVEGAELCWEYEGAALGRNICTIQCGGDADCEAIEGGRCEDFQTGGGVVSFCMPGGDGG